ncbi:MAG: hypothetical protein IGBAC_2035 [Ignavibacteriae bacterium]|nr:MAG: hypothetical protein IGBAC_2035 [Ignavibacteriota bacterium]
MDILIINRMEINTRKTEIYINFLLISIAFFLKYIKIKFQKHKYPKLYL